MPEPIVDEIKCHKSLAIVDRYYGFFNYLYPMIINLSGKHRVLRDKTLEAMIHQISLFNDAAKSGQVSRLYLADSGLASLREFLRMLSDPHVKLISRRQYGVALTHLAEVGAMTGGWIKSMQKR